MSTTYKRLPTSETEYPQTSPSSPRSQKHILCLLALSTLFLTTILLAAGLALTDRRIDRMCQQRIFPTPYTMDEDPRYYDLGPTGDAAWASLFTANNGYVYRQQQGAGEGEDKLRVFGISMFHQLHCLQMLRGQLRGVNETLRREDAEEHEHEHHWVHCLDYLRRTTLCLADDTLEAPRDDPHDPGHDIVSGKGARMCRDSGKLYEWSRMSGDSFELRKKVMDEGGAWAEPEGIEWPEPLE